MGVATIYKNALVSFMRSLDLVFAVLTAYYLHRLPDFRGKWRLLRPLDGVLSGVPVPSRYAGVRLALDVADRTNQFCILGRYDDVVPDEVNRLEEGIASSTWAPIAAFSLSWRAIALANRDW